MPSSLKQITVNDTGYAKVPVGTTAQRPSINAGAFRYNTSNSELEYYDNKWNSKEKLLMWLDAENSSSYPGSGSIWYDLSGNNNHVSLINSPSYTSGSGAYFSFNGSSNYMRTCKSIDLAYDGYFTIEIAWYNGNPNQFAGLWEHSGDWNLNPRGMGLFVNTSGGGNVLGLAHQNHSNSSDILNGGSGPRNFSIRQTAGWTITTQQFSSQSDNIGCRAWVDGNFAAYHPTQTTRPMSYDKPSVGRVDNIFFGCRGDASGEGPNFYFTGRIASIKAWASKRTDAQVLASYNTIKSRYGL
jgi:hypothetical protein